MLAFLFSSTGLTSIAVVAVAGVIGVQTLRLHMVDHEIASMKAAEAAQLSQSAATKETAAQAQIQTVTKTIIQRIPVYVTAKTNAAFPEPVGTLRLYDESIGLPLTTSKPDDSASGLGSGDFASVFVPNNRSCIADQERLAALQAFDTARAPTKKGFSWPWSH